MDTILGENSKCLLGSCCDFQRRHLLGPHGVHSPVSLQLWRTYVLDFLEQFSFHFFSWAGHVSLFWVRRTRRRQGRHRASGERADSQCAVVGPARPPRMGPCSTWQVREEVQRARWAGTNVCTQKGLQGTLPLTPRHPILSHPSREEFRFLQSSIVGQIKPLLALDLGDLCKQIVQLVNQAPGSKVHTIKYLLLIYVQD